MSLSKSHPLQVQLCLAATLSLLLAGGCTPLLPPEPPPPPPEEVKTLTPVGWEEVEGWRTDDPALALDALKRSCQVLRKKPEYEQACRLALTLDVENSEVVRAYFESEFVPHRVRNDDGSDAGTVTGYYVPDLNGSRTPSPDFPYPLYAPPQDLLIVDLSSVYPELKNMRLRGRLEGRRVVPYFERAQIDGDPELLVGSEILWIDDPVEVFFLHIQGSGRVRLPDGELLMAHYADQNGHPFRSIGKVLIDRGDIPREGLSMQGIKAWARKNPAKVGDLLASNPSYVFFSTSPYQGPPPGALGVSLTPGRSIAVDRRYVPLGAPVFLSTTWPGSQQPLQRLMLAQDTGGAIRGAVRADFFWGLGDEAGHFAGRMKEQGKMWVLLPRGVPAEAVAQR